MLNNVPKLKLILLMLSVMTSHYSHMSATNWHLSRALPTTEQQRHLPSVSMEIEPHAAIAFDLQQPLREFRVQ